MKHFLLTLMIASSFITGYAKNHWIDYATNEISDKEIQCITKREIKNVPEGVLVTYEITGAMVEDDPMFENCVRLNLDNFGVAGTLGNYAIPGTLNRFYVPNGCDAEIEVRNADYAEFYCSLAPAIPEVPESMRPLTKEEILSQLKSHDGYFPTNIISKNGIQTYRGHNIMEVVLQPIQYDSQKKKARAYKSIEYLVRFVASDDAALNRPIDIHVPTSEFQKMGCLNAFEESDYLSMTTNTNQNPKQYVILSTTKYADQVTKFANWKRIMGYNVITMVQSQWSYSTARAALINRYNQTPFDYLLILGEYEDIPGKDAYLAGFTCESCNEYYSTDYYYSCLEDESDTMQDILIGRLSVSTTDEAETVIDKIIGYENNPPSAAFFNNGILCAYFQSDSSPYTSETRHFVKTSETVRDYLLTFSKNIKRIYYAQGYVNPLYWNNNVYSYGGSLPNDLKRPTFQWDGSEQEIINSLNSATGAWYMLHRGHGLAAGWGDPFFRTSSLSQLTNGNKLPIVFSIECLCGKLDNVNPCFAEAFLRKENGGCVAILAASNSSFSGLNDALTAGLFNSIWPTPGFIMNMRNSVNETTPFLDESARELGEIVKYGFYHMVNTYYSGQAKRQYNKEIFHLFGDPSMEFYSTAPGTFNGRISVTRNMGQGMVSVSGAPSTAQINFFNPVTGQVQVSQGPNATYTSLNTSRITVCIRGKNMRNKIYYGTNSGFMSLEDPTDYLNNPAEFCFPSTNDLINDNMAESVLIDIRGSNLHVQNASRNELTLSVCHTDGRVLMEQSISRGQSQIDLSALSTGFYVVSVDDGKKILRTEKITIK